MIKGPLQVSGGEDCASVAVLQQVLNDRQQFGHDSHVETRIVTCSPPATGALLYSVQRTCPLGRGWPDDTSIEQNGEFILGGCQSHSNESAWTHEDGRTSRMYDVPFLEQLLIQLLQLLIV